tara:strand:+ start:24 stop:815 length:792 start_codon:yes stop_codon:yes gene_type:complete
MSVTVYVYNNTHTVIVNTSANQGSVTMYDKTIKLYQGIDNTVKFELKDSDRNAVNLTNMTVTINIIDSNSKETSISRPLTITNAVNGQATLSLTSADLYNIADGLYNYSLFTTDSNSEQQIVFTDLNRAAVGTVEIIEGVMPSPAETLIMEWNPGTDDGTWYYSNAVAGASERNLTSSSHTIAVYTSSFDGKFKMQGNLNNTASNDNNDWFDIPLTTGTTEVTLTNSDTLASYRFVSQAKWVRTAYDPDAGNAGTFTKVLIRN